jgi:hypothetical protein
VSAFSQEYRHLPILPLIPPETPEQFHSADIHFRRSRVAAFLKPDLTPPGSTLALVEGWILGVAGLIREHDWVRKAIERHLEMRKE